MKRLGIDIETDTPPPAEITYDPFSLCPHCGAAIAHGAPKECPACLQKITPSTSMGIRGFFVYTFVCVIALVVVAFSMSFLHKLILFLK